MIGGRAVRRADDTGAHGVVHIKAEKDCQNDRQENTELRRSAEEKHTRVGKQGAEIDHRANADEQHEGENLVHIDPLFEQPGDDAVFPHHARKREVDKDRAETHGQQKGRFKVLFHRQPDEQGRRSPT